VYYPPGVCPRLAALQTQADFAKTLREAERKRIASGGKGKFIFVLLRHNI